LQIQAIPEKQKRRPMFKDQGLFMLDDTEKIGYDRNKIKRYAIRGYRMAALHLPRQNNF
jgi:hypothetical protein